uniref:RNase H type-1 domain-containing protein n=1 Tax=Cajanus cajan TaxID=3821 RepID=A0A151SF43_CAJCA|nr:hypothetical protein KK1_024589 [Cajanus cajan]
MLYGLKILKERNFSDQIIIESDSIIAIQFLNEGCPRTHSCYGLVNQVVKAAGDFNNIECTHTLREAN